MCMLSGCQDRKSAVRKASLRWFTGLVLSACARSGNCAPSLMKKTCKGTGTASQSVLPQAMLCLHWEHDRSEVCSLGRSHAHREVVADLHSRPVYVLTRDGTRNPPADALPQCIAITSAKLLTRSQLPWLV